jgi:hypothetical protein
MEPPADYGDHLKVCKQCVGVLHILSWLFQILNFPKNIYGDKL